MKQNETLGMVYICTQAQSPYRIAPEGDFIVGLRVEHLVSHCSTSLAEQYWTRRRRQFTGFDLEVQRNEREDKALRGRLQLRPPSRMSQPTFKSWTR